MYEYIQNVVNFLLIENYSPKNIRFQTVTYSSRYINDLEVVRMFCNRLVLFPAVGMVGIHKDLLVLLFLCSSSASRIHVRPVASGKSSLKG